MFGVALLLILAAALFTIYCDYKQGRYDDYTSATTNHEQGEHNE